MPSQQRISLALIIVAFGAAIAIAAAGRLVLAQPEPASCPMMDGERPELTVTVQRDAKGATLKLAAKNAADVAKVQQLAEHLAQRIEEGCPMYGSKGHMHGKGMHGKAMHGGHNGPHHGAK